MPYELEYKKVHNTLMGKRHDNIFGNSLGQKVTSPEVTGTKQYIIDLDVGGDTQLVIHNLADEANRIYFYILPEDSSTAISPYCVNFKDNTRYHQVSVGTSNYIYYSIPANDYALIVLPNKVTFLTNMNGTWGWVSPGRIKIIGTYDFSIYYTDNYIVDAVSDGIVVDYIETIINDTNDNYVAVEKFDDIWTWNKKNENVLDDLKTEINSWTLQLDSNSSAYTVIVNVNHENPGSYVDSLESLLELAEYDLVLIPYRYYSNQCINARKRNTVSPIMNINNTRNERQQTYKRTRTSTGITTGHINATFYIEPINITFNTHGEWRLSLTKIPVTNLSSTWHSLSFGIDYRKYLNASLRGNTLYCLSNPQKLLTLCTACGYDSGGVADERTNIHPGNTYIQVAVGLQKKLPQNSNIRAHSGCEIAYSRMIEYTFTLPRHALASTEREDFPVIKINE